MMRRNLMSPIFTRGALPVFLEVSVPNQATTSECLRTRLSRSLRHSCAGATRTAFNRSSSGVAPALYEWMIISSMRCQARVLRLIGAFYFNFLSVAIAPFLCDWNITNPIRILA